MSRATGSAIADAVGTAADVTLRRSAADFILGEARLLDQRRYEDWAALFADDGIYWVPAKPGQENPVEHVSLFWDDKHLLQARIARLRHPDIHVQTPPSQVSHIVSDILVETNADTGPGCIDSYASFLMLEYRADWGQRLFGGHVRHRLRRRGDSFEIVLKRVDLVNAEAVQPALAVPF